MARNHIWGALLAGGLAAASTSAAGAADLRAYPIKAPPAAQAFNWSGLYVGGHAGYAWSGKDWFVSTMFGPRLQSHVDVDGALAGGQIGFNQQFGHLVLGVEGELAWTGLRGSSFMPFGPFSLTFADRADWLATVTGRAGFAVDRWLVYVRTGAAWARERHSEVEVTPVGTLALDATQTRAGWIVGGGVEWAFTASWSVRLAYDYIDFGQRRIDLTGTFAGNPLLLTYDIQQKVQLATVGVNYRFWQGPASSGSMAPLTAAFNWTGLYIGGHIGHGWGRKSWDVDVAPSYRVSGILGGGQLGFNAQHGQMVFGVEGDVSAANIDGSTTFLTSSINPNDTTNTLSSRIDWLETMTGRLGFAVDRWLVYSKVGAAWAHERHAIAASLPGSAAALDGREWRSGFTAGGGIEVALLDQWSLKAEYDYVNFGKSGVALTGAFAGAGGPLPVGPISAAELVRQDLHLVKLGVNDHFNSAAPTVIAKY